MRPLQCPAARTRSAPINARTAINTLSSLLLPAACALVAHTTAYQQQMWPPSRVIHVHPVIVVRLALGVLTLLLDRRRRAPEPAQRLARWLPIVAWCLLGIGVAIIPVFLPGLSPA
jgi:hypothetical protein